MPLRRWSGSAYVPANLARSGVSTVPQFGYIWDGSKYVQVWPDVVYNYYYTDDFNRANGGLGTNWSRYASDIDSRIVSNVAQAGAVAAATGRQGCGWMIHKDSMLSDNVRIKATIAASSPTKSIQTYTSLFMSANTPYTNTANRLLMCHIPWTGGPLAELMVVNGNQFGVGLSVPTGSPSETLDQSSEGVVAGDVIEFTRNGTSVIVLKNGLEWMSATTSAPLTGASNRRWGFVTEAEYPFLQAQYSSPGIDKIEAGNF